jgi:pyridoxal 5'-phosphate synthase pdxS subunit
VMAKARIGHFAEAQVLEVLGVDYIDESEVITPADEEHHIDKWAFQVPFFYGATRKQMISIRRSSTRNCRTEL